MRVADNPLSRNLRSIFGDRFNKDFKRKVLAMDLNLSPSTVKNWIAQSRENPRLPHRLPHLATVLQIANKLNLDLWNLFQDPVAESIQEKETNVLVSKILKIKNKDLLHTVEQTADLALKLQNMEQNKTNQNALK